MAKAKFNRSGARAYLAGRFKKAVHANLLIRAMKRAQSVGVPKRLVREVYALLEHRLDDCESLAVTFKNGELSSPIAHTLGASEKEVDVILGAMLEPRTPSDPRRKVASGRSR
jgi:hypothetical protein